MNAAEGVLRDRDWGKPEEDSGAVVDVFGVVRVEHSKPDVVNEHFKGFGTSGAKSEVGEDVCGGGGQGNAAVWAAGGRG